MFLEFYSRVKQYFFTEAFFKTKTYKFILCFLLSMLYAVCSQIVINLPFGLVPISLQPLPLFLCVFIFGSIALYAYGLYFFQGLLGAPFFSNFRGGFLHIAGPTGGYLIGFFFAMLFLFFAREIKTQSFWFNLVKLLVANVILYTFGLFQLSLFVSLDKLFYVGLFPFLVGDTIKMFVAAFAVSILNRKKKIS